MTRVIPVAWKAWEPGRVSRPGGQRGLWYISASGRRKSPRPRGGKDPMDVKTDRIALALKRVPMFSGLKPEEIAMVASLGTLVEHDGGDYLWRAGDESTYLTVLLRGRVKVVKGTPDGGSMILEIFGAGEPVGALVIYNYMPYPADAVCMEPLTLFKIHRRDFFDMLDHNPEIARGLIRELTREVDRGHGVCIIVGHAGAEADAERIGRELEPIAETLMVQPLGPVVGAHAGPGVVGVGCYPAELFPLGNKPARAAASSR